MSRPTSDVQIIRQNGQPAFAVIPYEEFLRLVGADDGEATIPHEVVGLVIEHDWPLVKAWRKHLGLSQKELARRAGISQPALSQMERRAANLRDATLEKLAKAMGLAVEQLVD